MVKICFIILHYMALEETVACIESIQRMHAQKFIRIVVVDNASPNGSGITLRDKYEGNEQVHVICNKENEGFSKGNNLGCQYARKMWNPEFYVVTNNDILFVQEDFLTLIENEFNASKFAVLGMDIYNTNLNVHQSPLNKKLPNTIQINKTIFLNRIMLYTMKVSYLFMKKYYHRINTLRQDAEDYDVYQKNVCVMGACMVFSRLYMDKREMPFWPETRFYYEEYLVALWCKQNHEAIVYTPQIKVWHKEGISTGMVHPIYKSQLIFRMNNILDAALIYRRELRKEKKKQK